MQTDKSARGLVCLPPNMLASLHVILPQSLGPPADSNSKMCYEVSIMPQFHPILYSLPSGGALGRTVEASDAEAACRQPACAMLKLNLPEVDRMFERGELEVVAVIKGDPQFEQTRRLPLFPGF